MQFKDITIRIIRNIRKYDNELANMALCDWAAINRLNVDDSITEGLNITEIKLSKFNEYVKLQETLSYIQYVLELNYYITPEDIFTDKNI